MLQMKVLKLFFLVAMVTTGVRSHSEPQCISRFDYDFKMLEKVHDLSEQVKQLGEKVKRQDEVINRLTDGAAKGFTSPIAFFADLSAGIKNPNKGDVIVFDDVKVNVGDAYSGEKGIFRAPVHGIYRFDLVLSSRPKNSRARLHLDIIHNHKRAAYVFLDNNAVYWLRRTTNVVVELRENDVIKTNVKLRDGDVWLDGCCLHSTFSGFMVQDM